MMKYLIVLSLLAASCGLSAEERETLYFCHTIDVENAEIELEVQLEVSTGALQVLLTEEVNEKPRLIKKYVVKERSEGTDTLYIGRDMKLKIGPGFRIRPGRNRAHSGEFRAVSRGKIYKGELRCG